MLNTHNNQTHLQQKNDTTAWMKSVSTCTVDQLRLTSHCGPWSFLWTRWGLGMRLREGSTHEHININICHNFVKFLLRLQVRREICTSKALPVHLEACPLKKRLTPTTVQQILPTLWKNSEQATEIYLGTCPTIICSCTELTLHSDPGHYHSLSYTALQ